MVTNSLDEGGDRVGKYDEAERECLLFVNCSLRLFFKLSA